MFYTSDPSIPEISPCVTPLLLDIWAARIIGGTSIAILRVTHLIEIMKIIAAYLLAQLGGIINPSADDIKNILASGIYIYIYMYFYTFGIEAEDSKIEYLLSQVEAKDITELIAMGRQKMASMPSGGAAAVAVAAPSGGGGAAAAAPIAFETQKVEKVEEKEESDDDMGFSLFD
ncbi:60S acidic ribosomal protein P2A-like [Senna tora]|uniref:60S acidic ribosomal protein P2A-like n=1 Tax=Senna tora TaxID=362788 RepID=A0A834TD13_9FABA|nr:60S acidic ribosomal protein P2A-like [Senna tora]